jgi:hypothetical protein
LEAGAVGVESTLVVDPPCSSSLPHAARVAATAIATPTTTALLRPWNEKREGRGFARPSLEKCQQRNRAYRTTK